MKDYRAWAQAKARAERTEAEIRTEAEARVRSTMPPVVKATLDGKLNEYLSDLIK